VSDHVARGWGVADAPSAALLEFHAGNEAVAEEVNVCDAPIVEQRAIETSNHLLNAS
jgi:hypothetical protein